MKIAFVGAGNMAKAMIEGWRPQSENVCLLERDEARRAQWAERGFETFAEPGTFLSTCRIWVMAVKPQQMQEVVQACKPFLQPNTLVISIAAGIDCAHLASCLGSPESPWPHLVRVMPNTPALVGQGVSGYYALPTVTPEEIQFTRQLFSAVGKVVACDTEDKMNAITALSGSGPGYVFYFIESLVAGGVALGLSSEEAHALALETVAGSVKLAQLSKEPPSVLRERVTSKGGTTQTALDVLEAQGWQKSLVLALQAAYKRAEALAEGLD